MNKRIFVHVVMIAALLCAPAAFGQSPDNPQEQGRSGDRAGRRPMTPEAQLDRMSSQLNLTDEQKEKIKPILEDQSRQMQALRGDNSSREDRRAKFQEIHQGTISKIRPILTGDQQQKLDDLMKRRSEGRRHNRDNDRQQENDRQQ
jgi:Spy/CpxP family protein refolding chaperone